MVRTKFVTVLGPTANTQAVATAKNDFPVGSVKHGRNCSNTA
jgi:hypothetical protein